MKGCHIDNDFGFLYFTPMGRRTGNKLKSEVSISPLRRDFVRLLTISSRNEQPWEIALLKKKMKEIVQFVVEGIPVLYG